VLIPIRTDRPRLRPAYLTLFLIVMNVGLHIYGAFLPMVPVEIEIGDEQLQAEMEWFIYHLGLWSGHPTPLTFLTHMFVHGGWLHLIGNMLFLWLFGSLIEDVLRPWGMAALYLAGGVLAAVAHLMISQFSGDTADVPLVGASGAIAALMGLFMLRFYRTKIEMFYMLTLYIRGTFWVASVWALAVWIGKELLEGFLSGEDGVAHWAHVGGFFAGAAAAPFLGSLSAARNEYFTDDPETNVEYVRRREVVTAAEKALRADPSNTYQMQRLARTYFEAGEVDRAHEAYRQCVHRFVSRNLLDQGAEVCREYLERAGGIPGDVPAETLGKLAQHLEGENP
jgi:membrane associated rhomboid family serine protease